MVARPDLPEEILIDIFSRLPTKSVGQSRSLSKNWHNLLSTPQFIKSHLAREKTGQENLILVTTSHAILSVETIKGNNINPVSRKLDLPLCLWSDIVGSCDGLVLLLTDGEWEIFLANPVTLEQVKIPDSPLALDQTENFKIYGFGYDSLRDDYKVVTISYYYWYQSYVPDQSIDTFVDVYSVKTGVWKRIESPPYSYSYSVHHTGAFVNGAIHWLAYKSRCRVIASFDLVNEVFFEIPAPTGVKMENMSLHIFVGLGGCLCVIDSGTMDLWVMKEYGVAKSWTKLRVYGYRSGDIVKPLCFVGDEEEEEGVLVVGGFRLVVCNVKEGTSRDLVVGGVSYEFVDGGIFVESLVSPAALHGHNGEQMRD